MSVDKSVKLVDAVLFATRLRLALEKIKSESKDENTKEYIDYLLKDDRNAKQE